MECQILGVQPVGYSWGQRRNSDDVQTENTANTTLYKPPLPAVLSHWLPFQVKLIL